MNIYPTRKEIIHVNFSLFIVSLSGLDFLWDLSPLILISP